MATTTTPDASVGSAAIHYAIKPDAEAPAFCGFGNPPKSATNWLYVTCSRCLGAGAVDNMVARGRLAALKLRKAGLRTG